MNAGYVKVSHELLRQALNLPDTWEVLRVFPPQAENYGMTYCELVISGPELPELIEGQMLPELQVYMTVGKKGAERLHSVTGDNFEYTFEEGNDE